MNPAFVDAVSRSLKTDERVGTKRVDVLSQHAAIGRADFQTGIERRSESRRHHLARNGFTCLRLKRPDIDVFTREDSPIDCDREGHSGRNRIAVDFLFDDFRQGADDELHARRHALGR